MGEELGGVSTRLPTHLPDWDVVKRENANRQPWQLIVLNLNIEAQNDIKKVSDLEFVWNTPRICGA